MLRFVSDENFKGAIVRGLLRQLPKLDLVRVQDVGLRTADDPTILAWAADQGRILLTRDRATVPDFAYERVRMGQLMPGVFVVHERMPIGKAIEAIRQLALESEPDRWRNRVEYLR